MTQETAESHSGYGTASSPKFFEGPSDINGDVHIRVRYFVYRTDEGLVAGRITNHRFTIDRAAKDIWPFLKDFNLWQNAYGYHYSGVVGDLEGKEFYLTPKNTPNANKVNEALLTPYQVVKVSPEHLIVIRQPVPEDGSTGAISPGFHVFMLNEHGGKTLVTVYTEHALRFKDKTEQQALAHFEEGSEETLRRFRDCFFPSLKKLVYENS